VSQKHDFLHNPAWLLLEANIVKKLEEITENAFQSPDWASFRYSAGYRDALRDILALPHQLLKEKDEPDAVAKERYVEHHQKLNPGQW
jgi:hypothetical protein